jgi:hypothetical protein
MRQARVRSIVGVVLTGLITSCSGGSTGQSATTTIATVAPTTTAEIAATALSPEAGLFVDAGISVTSIDSPVAGTAGLSMTDWQADNLMRQARDGEGLTGSELRQRFAMSADVVPIDFIVAAWLQTATSPPSDIARTLMPDTPITDPTDVVFPNAVLALFVQDAAAAEAVSSDPAVAPPTSGGPPRSPHRSPAAPGARLDICAALLNFYDGVINTVVELLGGKDSWWGGLALQAVGLMPSSIPPGAINIPKKNNDLGVFQALGLVIALAGAISPWSAIIEADPVGPIPYGVAPAPGNQGILRTVLDPGPTIEWPAPLKSCAELVGLELPSLDPVGSIVEWETTFAEHATVVDMDGVIQNINDRYVANLKYTTSVETAEQAAGTPIEGLMLASAQVKRPGNQTFKAIVEEIVRRALKSDTLVAILDFVIGGALETIDEMTNPSPAIVFVTTVHHEAPPPPTATDVAPTTPEGAPPGASGPCVGRDLYSTPAVGMAAYVLLRIDPNGTLRFDFSGSSPYETTQDGVTVSVQLGGSITGSWTGTDQVINTTDNQINVGGFVTVLGQQIDLPPEFFNGFATTSETLQCTPDGAIVVERTGQVFQ